MDDWKEWKIGFFTGLIVGTTAMFLICLGIGLYMG